jgi:8-oxo-dGTP pyrophosphatase MutT (NUDIX family)
MRDSVEAVHDLVANVSPSDASETEHISSTLRWLEATDDVFRRTKPAIPDRHLVSYVVLLEHDTFDVLLVDHVNSGLFLPPGGHVEPDEHPAETARRECREELGIEVSLAGNGVNPTFLTVTKTIGLDPGHTDVSLWFIGEGSQRLRLTVDEVEFHGARWWSAEEVAATNKEVFDPHFHRFWRKAFSMR